MDGSIIMEPGLTQAVRIVLKYEIQSLLSRLSETGEEYIVLTASTDEGTCGHIGSMKGEGFVQMSDLQAVKRQFLNFCTGNTGSGNKMSADNVNPVYTVTSTPKPHRRKSTPRCKFQNSSSGKLNIGHIKQERDLVQSDKQVAYPHTAKLEDSALDLSDKNGAYSDKNGVYCDKSSAYSYTLDSKDEARYSSSVSLSSFYDYKMEEFDGKVVVPGAEVQPYTWQEEKLPIPVSETLKNEITTDGRKNESSIDEILKNKGLGIQEQISYMDESINNLINDVANGKPESGVKNRRKSKKAPVRIQRRVSKEMVGAESLLNSDVPMLNSEDSISKEDDLSGEVKPDVNTSEGVYDGYINNHASVKQAVAANLKKNAKKNNLQNITDMKSAFEEIGNMAKCLICNKVLANKNNRTFHWRSHVGDKRYRCDICNKAFTHPSNMRSHRKIHTDEKPFPCDLCDRRFRRRDYLLQHLERFHYNPKQSLDKMLNESESNSS